MAINAHTQTFVLGAGKLYFAPQNTDGTYEGDRYLGDTPGFSITIESEKSELWDSDGPTAEQVGTVTTKITRTAALTVKDISADNLALFIGGEKSTVTQSNTPVTGESVGAAATLVADRSYQLGISTANPVGVRGISSVAIKKGATTYVLDTDYELDTDLGRIRVLSTGALAGQSGVTADYTPANNSRTRVSTADVASKRGRLTYIARNSSGANKDLVGPLVDLRPSGELAWKSRDTWQEMGFDLEFLKADTSTAAIYIDGRPA